MFNLSDSTADLEAKLEAFSAMEANERNKRHLYLICLIVWSIPNAVMLRWTPLDPANGMFWRFIVSAAVEIALIALWLAAWFRLSKARGLMMSAEKELSRRKHSSL